MSYYSNQPPVGAPPPQGYPQTERNSKDAYPPPGYPPQGQGGYPHGWAQGYPPQGYPPTYAPQYAAAPPQQKPAGPSFMEGCLAALCCCCLLDACF